MHGSFFLLHEPKTCTWDQLPHTTAKRAHMCCWKVAKWFCKLHTQESCSHLGIPFTTYRAEMTWQRIVVSCLYEPSEVQPILLSLRFAMTDASQMLRLPIIYLLIASRNRPTRNTNWLVSTHQSVSHHLIANKLCPSLAASTAEMVSMADGTAAFTMMMFMT